MKDCCLQTVPQSDSSYETFGPAVVEWQERLTAGLDQSIQASNETLGDMEEQILRQTQGLERKLLEEAAQKKADQTPPICPVCGHPLSRCTGDQARTFHTRFGPVTVKRLRGWCRRCKQWRYPADQAMGLSDTGGASPGVQEMAALTVSKLPVNEASAVIERLTGVKLPPATLDREARRQGQRADKKRKQLDEQMCAGQGVQQKLALPPEAFTLVIELDAWNIRERDDWGQSAQKRACGQEPQRWHWAYGGTCFRLDQRVEGEGGRARILSRGTVMTRGGVDDLRQQLFAEAQRQGLAQADKVLVIADGALWIWNLAGDRFAQAQQRLDYYHASQHLWAVAHALHPQDQGAARDWIKPLLKKLKAGRVTSLLSDLHTLVKRLRKKKRQAVESELNYMESHRKRMDYAAARRAGEPQGSGAMESTCRQYQCRFKRPGQFWSCVGDEGLMCLETFWRNRRWHLLYPHILHGDPHKN
ncbi:MAG TPA: ISKra4 family transposase [Candidatus Acidoferrum sp.]|nr:ISKra4 family transposase [Candidatus Acidoferrum sp.]